MFCCSHVLLQCLVCDSPGNRLVLLIIVIWTGSSNKEDLFICPDHGYMKPSLVPRICLDVKLVIRLITLGTDLWCPFSLNVNLSL